jgi:hypothetical protein
MTCSDMLLDAAYTHGMHPMRHEWTMRAVASMAAAEVKKAET